MIIKSNGQKRCRLSCKNCFLMLSKMLSVLQLQSEDIYFPDSQLLPAIEWKDAYYQEGYVRLFHTRNEVGYREAKLRLLLRESCSNKQGNHTI